MAVSLQHVPGGHLSHVATDEMPVLLLNVPTGQGMGRGDILELQ